MELVVRTVTRPELDKAVEVEEKAMKGSGYLRDVSELFLSDEDKKMITKFIAENFPNGYTMSVDWESYKEFDTNPAFGKACKTYKVTFITES